MFNKITFIEGFYNSLERYLYGLSVRHILFKYL